MSEDDDGSRTESISFEVGPNVREVNDGAVAAFDSALGSVGRGEVMHMIDPTRINAFSSGGPPVWSVATVPVDGGQLYLTYGFSSAIDPARAGCSFELAIGVGDGGSMWPGLLLRALCRYMLGSGRDLEVGQAMPFPDAITRFFAPMHERENYPATAMHGALFAHDPALPSIQTPSGDVEVRRVVGIYPDEQQLLELWSVAGFVQSIAARDPALLTDIARPTYANDPQVVAAIKAGSAAEGSSVAYVAVPGVGWTNDDDGLKVRFPGGAHALRIHRMLRARLPFGNHLLVQDDNPDNTAAVAFEPAQEFGLRAEGPVLVIETPPDHELLEGFPQSKDAPELAWNFKV